jgi:hypothetical protein
MGSFEAANNAGRSREERLQKLLDKDEIRDVIARSCRAIDRLDPELLASCFHPDAEVNYAPLTAGSAQGLIDSVPGADRLFDKSQYNIGTQLIEVDGDIARAETYIWCAKILPDRHENGGQYGRISGFRYVEKHQRRNGQWRILFRAMIPDWGMFHVLPVEPKTIGMFKTPSEWTLRPIPSKRDRTDISYQI